MMYLVFHQFLHIVASQKSLASSSFPSVAALMEHT